MRSSIKNISALFLVFAVLLLAWRVWAQFPLWLLGVLFSASLSFITLSVAFLQDKQTYQLLQRQKECLSAEVDGLRALRKTLADEQQSEKERMQVLESSLEETLEQLRNLRQQVYLEREAAEGMHLIRHQYLQLKKHFEEKKEQIKEIRREYFELEGRFLALQRECEQQELERHYMGEASNELASVILEENRALQTQVEELETLISHLLTQKKQPERKKGDPLQKMLELQF